MKKVFIAFILILFGTCLFAQGEANHWFFGENIKLSFTTHDGEPVELDNEDTGFFDFSRGAATISDKDGNLLFFTNGDTVWNRNYEIMKNGLDTSKGDYSRQIIILKKPGSENLYYIFCSRHNLTGPPPEPDLLDSLLYHIVDISENKGLGKVVKWNGLLSIGISSYSLGATQHSNLKDFWIICHDEQTNVFKTFILDKSGLYKNPIISYCTIEFPQSSRIQNFLNISPSGSKLISKWHYSYEYPSGNGIKTLIYDFDKEN